MFPRDGDVIGATVSGSMFVPSSCSAIQHAVLREFSPSGLSHLLNCPAKILATSSGRVPGPSESAESDHSWVWYSNLGMLGFRPRPVQITSRLETPEEILKCRKH